jgi:hypothetical protein
MARDRARALTGGGSSSDRRRAGTVPALYLFDPDG